jgi:hypothetical protein
MKQIFLASIVCCVSLVAGCWSGTAIARDGIVTKVVTQTRIVRKNTPAYAELRAYLMSKGATSGTYSAADLAIDKLGDFVVQTTRHYEGPSGSVAPLGESDPPALPPSGPENAPGDAFSVSSCAGGVSQSWIWTHVGSGISGHWVLTSYTMKRVVSSTAPGV